VWDVAANAIISRLSERAAERSTGDAPPPWEAGSSVVALCWAGAPATLVALMSTNVLVLWDVGRERLLCALRVGLDAGLQGLSPCAADPRQLALWAADGSFLVAQVLDPARGEIPMAQHRPVGAAPPPQLRCAGLPAPCRRRLLALLLA